MVRTFNKEYLFWIWHKNCLLYNKNLPSMTKVIREIYNSFNIVFDNFFNSNDSLISKEGQQILSNSIDKKTYFDALEELKSNKTNESKEILTKEITLSNGENITVVY